MEALAFLMLDTTLSRAPMQTHAKVRAQGRAIGATMTLVPPLPTPSEPRPTP